MSSQTTLNLVIGVAVLGLLIYRQLQAGPCAAISDWCWCSP
jgi:hypothetical protein